MSDTIDVKPTSGIDLRRDGRGLALFTGGAFFAVLLALAVGSSEPLERVTGTGVLARLWSLTVGLLPGLVFCMGIAGLGAWEFLAGDAKDLKRHARGLALTALGLTIFLGAFSDAAGGLLGYYSSGAIARYVHIVPAALIGFAAFLIPVWSFWLKPMILEGAEAEIPEVAEPEPGAVASAVAEATSRPAPQVDVGVTAAEAAALIPHDLPSWRALPRKFASHEALPIPHSPYPEDVRRRGEIPQGAKPLHARTPEAEPVAISARKDIVLPPAKIGPDPVLEMLPSIEPHEREKVFDELRLALEELASREPESEAQVEVAPEPTAEEVVEAETEEAEAAVPIRPTWEQPDLFSEEDEPVDAYGTPISVVESVRAGHEDEPVAEPEEREVTLKPVAAARVRKKRPPKSTETPQSPEPSPSPTGDRSQLLAEIGCHLLERGRVAVSMLQKQYGMDFEEATSVLDELQRMGLIGPYLGGQRRDILLTREEWLEKVSSL